MKSTSVRQRYTNPYNMDEKRMAWAMGDIIENRPPLSRWHKDWAGSFNKFSREK